MAHPTQDPRTQASTLADIRDLRARTPDRITCARILRSRAYLARESGRGDLATWYEIEIHVLWEEATADAENTDNWDEAAAIEALIEDK